MYIHEYCCSRSGVCVTHSTVGECTRLSARSPLLPLCCYFGRIHTSHMRTSAGCRVYGNIANKRMEQHIHGMLYMLYLCYEYYGTNFQDILTLSKINEDLFSYFCYLFICLIFLFSYLLSTQRFFFALFIL